MAQRVGLIGIFCAGLLGSFGCTPAPQQQAQIDSFLKNKYCSRADYQTWRMDFIRYKNKHGHFIDQSESTWSSENARRFEAISFRTARLEFCETGLETIRTQCDQLAGVVVGSQRMLGTRKEDIPHGGVGVCGAAVEFSDSDDPITHAEYARARLTHYARYKLAFDKDLGETVSKAQALGHPSALVSACEYYFAVFANGWNIPENYALGDARSACRSANSAAPSPSNTYALGVFDEFGIEAPIDLEAALEWYKTTLNLGLDVSEAYDRVKSKIKAEKDWEAEMAAKEEEASSQHMQQEALAREENSRQDDSIVAVAGLLTLGCLLFEKCREGAADFASEVAKKAAVDYTVKVLERMNEKTDEQKQN